jgi:hypothetical protein
MHAYALNSLEDYLKEGTTVLDVGCGSGYRMSFFPSLLLVSALRELKENNGGTLMADNDNRIVLCRFAVHSKMQ